MRLRPLPYRKVAKRLSDFGFQPVRSRGSHVFFEHDDGRNTVVPNHPGEDIGRGMLRKILRDIDITPVVFFEEL